MLIEGPLKIAIAEPEDGQGKILVMGFEAEFQSLNLAQQGQQFQRYLNSLTEAIEQDANLDQRNRAGMLIVQQVVEQLLPHVMAGELDLGETMTVQIRQEDQASSLSSLVGS